MIPKTYNAEDLEKMRSGQKMVIVAIALNLAGLVLRLTVPSPAIGLMIGLFSLVAVCLAIIGLIRLTGGLMYPIIGRVLCCILMVVPLVNIIILGIINSSATKILRDNGYAVGLLGAQQKLP